MNNKRKIKRSLYTCCYHLYYDKRLCMGADESVY